MFTLEINIKHISKSTMLQLKKHISALKGWKQVDEKKSRCVWAQWLRRVQLFAIPWTVACQAPLSMEFSRQEQWSGLPFPPPGDLPDPGIEPEFPAAPALASRFFTTELPEKPQSLDNCKQKKWYSLVNIRQSKTLRWIFILEIESRSLYTDRRYNSQGMRCFPGRSEVKNLPANAEDEGSVPESGRSPGEGNGNCLQFSHMENATDKRAWWATVHGVAKSWTWLSN